jgi:hypothetical protein
MTRIFLNIWVLMILFSNLVLIIIIGLKSSQISSPNHKPYRHYRITIIRGTLILHWKSLSIVIWI